MYYNYPNSYPQYGMAGYTYPTQPMVKGTQVLTQDQINYLRHKVDNKVQITQEDALRSRCTHKDINGVLTLEPEGQDGSVARCTICGAVFDTKQIPQQTLQEAIATVTDCLQQTKTWWLDIPPEVAKDYMTILPLLEKLPYLYNVATDHWNRAMSNSYLQPVNASYGAGFNAVDSIIATGMVPMNPIYGGYQQPMYQQQAPMYQQQPQPQVAPQYAAPYGQAQPMPQMQQPVQNPMGGMVAPQQYYQPAFPVAPSGNVFGYEGTQTVQPQPMTQVQPQAYQQAPMGAPVAPQPQAQPQQAVQTPVAPPTAPAEVPTVEKKFNL